VPQFQHGGRQLQSQIQSKPSWKRLIRCPSKTIFAIPTRVTAATKRHSDVQGCCWSCSCSNAASSFAPNVVVKPITHALRFFRNIFVRPLSRIATTPLCRFYTFTPQHNVADASQTYQRRKVTCIRAHPLSKLSISVSHTARMSSIVIQCLPGIFRQMLPSIVQVNDCRSRLAGALLPFLLSIPPTPSTVRTR
jgi:hypothetical protein